MLIKDIYFIHLKCQIHTIRVTVNRDLIHRQLIVLNKITRTQNGMQNLTID